MITKIIRNLKILPRWVIILIDLFFISLSALLGYLLRFNFSIRDLEINNADQGVLLYSACGLVSILITGSYRGIIRYTGIQDSARIFFMVGLNLLLIAGANLLNFYYTQHNVVPYSVILIAFLSSFLLLFNYRLLVKYFFAYYRNQIVEKSNIVIYGAGQSGMITKQVIDASSNMRVVGFLEDDINKIGKFLGGTKIYANGDPSIDSLLRELNVDELVITAKDLPYEKKADIVEACLKNQVKVRAIPPIEKWVKGELSLNQIKDIRIEDLLGREAIHLSVENVSRELSGKIVCVTGAAGSIGSEIVIQVLGFRPKKVILIDQDESALYELERELLKMQTSIAFFLIWPTSQIRPE